MMNDKLIKDDSKLSSQVQVPKAHPPAITHATTIKLTGKNQSPKLPTLENSQQVDSTIIGGVATTQPQPVTQQHWEPRSFSNRKN